MTDIQLIEKQVNESLLLIGIKIDAIKSTLTDKQLEQFNNYILDYINSNKETLEKVLSPQKFQELLNAAQG